MPPNAVHEMVPTEFNYFPDMDYSKLHYVKEMLGELRKLSDDLDEKILHYLIEMALLEANTRLENIQVQKELIV